MRLMENEIKYLNPGACCFSRFAANGAMRRGTRDISPAAALFQSAGQSDFPREVTYVERNYVCTGDL